MAMIAASLLARTLIDRAAGGPAEAACCPVF